MPFVLDVKGERTYKLEDKSVASLVLFVVGGVTINEKEEEFWKLELLYCFVIDVCLVFSLMSLCVAGGPEVSVLVLFCGLVKMLRCFQKAGLVEVSIHRKQ